jgi:CheY-like chemotaxis protein
VVGEADSGEAAIPLVEQLVPDVVLMDCRMPGQGGVAATADGQEILQRVVRQGKRLRDMVEQLLQASAFAANRSPVLRAEAVMAAEVVAEVVDDWRLAEPDRRVELRLPDLAPV